MIESIGAALISSVGTHWVGADFREMSMACQGANRGCKVNIFFFLYALSEIIKVEPSCIYFDGIHTFDRIRNEYIMCLANKNHIFLMWTKFDHCWFHPYGFVKCAYVDCSWQVTFFFSFSILKCVPTPSNGISLWLLLLYFRMFAIHC